MNNLQDMWGLQLSALAVWLIVFWQQMRSFAKRRERTGISGSEKALGWCWVTGLSVIALFVSWFMNLGLVRRAFTLFPLPLVHFCLYSFLNYKVLENRRVYEKNTLIAPLSCATCLLFYMLAPDVAESGEVFALFGLIKGAEAAGFLMMPSLFLFVGNIIMMILEVVILCKDKKERRNDRQK